LALGNRGIKQQFSAASACGIPRAATRAAIDITKQLVSSMIITGPSQPQAAATNKPITSTTESKTLSTAPAFADRKSKHPRTLAPTLRRSGSETPDST